MVLKVSKGGIRSGNSFKRINKSAYQRNYRTHAVIIKNLIISGDNIERQNIVGDVDLKASRIPYSINKKGRWELPSLIQNKIVDGEFDDRPYNVQVVERHKLFRKSNCISVHTSRKPWSWKKAKNWSHRNVGYLNADSLLDGRRKRRPRQVRPSRVITRRGRIVRLRSQSFDRFDNNNEEEDVIPSSVRYEVLYPPSRTSGVNYTRSVRDPYQSDYCPCRRRCNCNSKKICNKSNKFRSLIREEIDLLENNELEEDKSMFCDPFKHSSENMEASRTINLSDLMKSKTLCKETRKRKRRKTSQINTDSGEVAYKNRKIIYEQVVPKEGTEKVMPVQETELNTRTQKCDAVLLSLSKNETNPLELRKKYDNRFIECRCYPRKFIIDISEHVKNKSSFRMIKRTIQFHACLVFTLDEYNETYANESSIFQVMLNTTSAKYSVGQRIETLFDYMESTVAECIKRTVLYMETLPEFFNEIEDTHSSVWKHNATPKNSCVAKCADWSNDTYIPNDEFYLSSYLQAENAHSKEIHISNRNTKELSGLTGKFCDICYDLLGDQTPGTALQSCRHWFCNSCWSEYLKDRVNSASTSLTCPEFDCDNRVDVGTALSILGFQDIIKHAKYCHDNKIEREEIAKWCPNTNCYRVVKVSSGDVKMVNCNCGQTFCFDCLGEPHWPAPCDTFTDYYKKLKETGDIGLAPVESLNHVIVNGKNCPHCKKFLEKDGGCPFMACVCGGTFCWGCGRDWNSNTHGNECYKNGYRNEHMTSEVTIEEDRRKSSNKKQKWYNVAVKHRTGLHPVKLRQLKTAKSKLVKHLASFIGKNSKRGVSVRLDFEGKRASYPLEQAKLPEYLNELISLHQELSRVAESTALIMDSNKLPQTYVLRLQYMIIRLSAIADEISKGFLSGSDRKPGELVEMFRNTRRQSLRTLKCLYATVNKCDL